MHEIGGHPRQCIITISNPAVFDRYVLTLDITHVGEPAAKRCIETHRGGLGEAAKIADHWRRLRLRRRGQRPRRCRAAEQRDELAPSHWPVPPVLPTERIAHFSYGRRLLHPSTR